MRALPPPLYKLCREYLRASFSLVLMHRPLPGGGCSCGANDCTRPGKHPRLRGWVENPIRDSASALQLLRAYPNSNIAIIAGNGLAVLDVDPRHGGDQELAALEKRYGSLPPGPTVITGGGGRHFYLKAQHTFRSAILASGIEFKSEGSCAIAPPSLHVSGQRYAWASDRGFDIELPPLPEWILERLHRGAPRAGMDMSKIIQGFPEGQRNIGMTRLAGLLIGKDIPLQLVASLLFAFDQHFNRPPMGYAEVSTVITSIATREIAKRKGTRNV